MPIRASGIATIHGIFERRAIDRLVRRKTAARSPAPAPTMILAVRDLIKISINPTSWYHHQSVTRETMLEKKIRIAIAIPMSVKEKVLKMFINTYYHIIKCAC